MLFRSRAEGKGCDAGIVDGRETKVGYKNVPIWLNKKRFVVPLIMDVDELQATIIIKLKIFF